MAPKIKLEVVTPAKVVVSDEVDLVAAPGVMGQFGVLPGHIPLLAALEPGEMHFTKDGRVEYLVVSEGFAEAGPAKVTILAESAELAREIDIDRALKAKERAEARLKQAKLAEEEHVRVEASLRRALARLKVAQRARS